jgi:hypothetical protein
MSCGDILFHVGAYEEFKLTLQTCEDGTVTADDISAATEVTVRVVTRSNPPTTLASKACTFGFSGADWANGIVTGAFEVSDTENITDYGWADVQVAVVIAGQSRVWHFKKAVNITGVGS